QRLVVGVGVHGHATPCSMPAKMDSGHLRSNTGRSWAGTYSTSPVSTISQVVSAGTTARRLTPPRSVTTNCSTPNHASVATFLTGPSWPSARAIRVTALVWRASQASAWRRRVSSSDALMYAFSLYVHEVSHRGSGSTFRLLSVTTCSI